MDRQMRTSTFAAVGGLLALALGLAGCSGGSGGTEADRSASPSVTSSSGGAPGGGTTPACVAGTWRSTGTRASGTVAGATGRVEGGESVMLEVDHAGGTRADFTGMQPMTFTASALGANVKGEFSYAGPVQGTIRFPDGDRRSGTWQPYGKLNWDGLKVTAKLTEPAQVTVLDNADVSELTGSKATQTGNAVDAQPIFRKGTYTCDGDTLTVSPSDNGPTITWTFKRQ